MSKSVRRNHSATFKAKVALEVLRGERTVPEIAAKRGDGNDSFYQFTQDRAAASWLGQL